MTARRDNVIPAWIIVVLINVTSGEHMCIYKAALGISSRDDNTLVLLCFYTLY